MRADVRYNRPHRSLGMMRPPQQFGPRNDLALMTRRLPASGCRLALGVVVATTCLAAVGCGGGDSQARLGSYLEELEFETPLEKVASIPLGKFRVPLAVRTADAPADMAPDWVEMRFELHAETNPENEEALKEAIERYRAPFRDGVIRVCRHTTADELGDPRNSALKSRLTELARMLLGEQRVRNLLIVPYTTTPL